MKKGDIVYAKDVVGAPALRRWSRQTIESVSKDGFTVKLKGWTGAGFSVNRFTLSRPNRKFIF